MKCDKCGSDAVLGFMAHSVYCLADCDRNETITIDGSTQHVHLGRRVKLTLESDILATVVAIYKQLDGSTGIVVHKDDGQGWNCSRNLETESITDHLTLIWDKPCWYVSRDCYEFIDDDISF